MREPSTLFNEPATSKVVPGQVRGRMRVLLAALALLVLSGCIAPDQAHQDNATPGSPPPPESRVDGMTWQEKHTDKQVACDNDNSTVRVPRFCAERDLTASGRVGVDKLPIGLVATNGGVSIRAGEGDAWSFHAVVRVSAPTQDMATQALDTAWTWSHQKDGTHRLDAGPATTPAPAPTPTTLPVGTTPGAQVVSTKYEVIVPSWILVDTLGVKGDNGGVIASGIHAGKVDLRTTNGGVSFTGSAADVTMSATNGGAAVALTPSATGRVELETVNGGVSATLRLDGDRAIDADGKSQNGGVTMNLHDGSYSANERTHKHYRSDGFDSAAIQTTLVAKTTNGGIVVTG